MSLRLRPSTFREANAYVLLHHRHHPPVHAYKFAIACEDGERLCGVVIVERPKARMLDDGLTLELSRVCTDGTKHAASKLISAAARAAFAMGALRVVSYVLDSELGTSYRAAGWVQSETDSKGGEWTRPSRKREAARAPTCPKVRWEKAA